MFAGGDLDEFQKQFLVGHNPCFVLTPVPTSDNNAQHRIAIRTRCLQNMGQDWIFDA